MADNAQDQDFLEFVVKSIVAHPEDVKLDRKVDEMGVLLTVDVHKEILLELLVEKDKLQMHYV